MGGSRFVELEQVTSIKDARVVQARELSTSVGRRKHGRCLLEGQQVIGWAFDNHILVDRVFYNIKCPDQSFLDHLHEKDVKCIAASEGILKKISDTNYLIPFVGVGVINSPIQSNEVGDFVLVLDGLKDHGNIGTIIRTCSAFGINEVLSTSYDLDLFYKKAIDASRGTVFRVNHKKFSSGLEVAKNLKHRGYQIVATSPHAPELQSLVKLQSKPVALVIGNETEGISNELMSEADITIRIPMNRGVESLNAGVAAGISIYELKLKVVISMLVNHIRKTLGREINVTGKCIQLALDKELSRLTSFNSTQIILMMVLKCDELMTVEQAWKDTAHFGNEFQELITPLLKQGYICYSANNHETIQLTSLGEQLLGQLWPIVEETEQGILKGFSREEQAQLFNFINRLRTNCENIMHSS
ncbi:MAG: hypothetical protein CVU90_11080 [Firmicutes bacterium HGW-Firmicutes-15]|nr:MAG: hypothetical protein CVU90_11080 [Firmicutes bacterium HGW-Firmicutes-15]